VFAERWNGGAHWSRQPVPAPAFSDPGFDFLSGVSCPSRTRCFAVGLDHPPIGANVSYDYSALAELWDGTTWSDNSPAVSQTSDSFLQAVSCVSASACVAVGQGLTSPLAMSWDGGSWRVEQAPRASPAMSILNGVSCSSARSCLAVGSTEPSATVAPRVLAERWNGRRWSTVRTPRTPAGESAMLNAVACTSRGCMAVGVLGPQQLIERWNGRTWSIQPLPPDAPGAGMNGVSCVSMSDCVAVGGLTNNSHQSVAERWDGHRWSVEPTPTPSGGSTLWAVSCPSSVECVAVGQRGPSPLIERWSGQRWSMVAAP
jgi:hypothetical protein